MTPNELDAKPTGREQDNAAEKTWQVRRTDGAAADRDPAPLRETRRESAEVDLFDNVPI